MALHVHVKLLYSASYINANKLRDTQEGPSELLGTEIYELKLLIRSIKWSHSGHQHIFCFIIIIYHTVFLKSKVSVWQ